MRQKELRSRQEELESEINRLKFRRDQLETETNFLKNQIERLKQEKSLLLREKSPLHRQGKSLREQVIRLLPITLITVSLLTNGLLYGIEKNSRKELQNLKQSLTEAQKQLALYRQKGLTPEVVENWEIYRDNQNSPYCLHIPKNYPVHYNIKGRWKYLKRHYEMCIPLNPHLKPNRK